MTRQRVGVITLLWSLESWKWSSPFWALPVEEQFPERADLMWTKISVNFYRNLRKSLCKLQICIYPFHPKKKSPKCIIDSSTTQEKTIQQLWNPQVTIFLDKERDEFREELYLSWSFCTTAVWVIEVTLEAIFWNKQTARGPMGESGVDSWDHEYVSWSSKML